MVLPPSLGMCLLLLSWLFHSVFNVSLVYFSMAVVSYSCHRFVIHINLQNWKKNYLFYSTITYCYAKSINYQKNKQKKETLIPRLRTVAKYDSFIFFHSDLCSHHFSGVTILLSLTVFLNMVSTTMPVTSDNPLLGKELSLRRSYSITRVHFGTGALQPQPNNYKSTTYS